MMTGLKFVLRGIKTNRLCAAIGILGLGLGLACTIVIVKYAWQEYTTNRFHANYDRLYYCVSRSSAISRPVLSEILNWSKKITDYPEVEAAAGLKLHREVKIEYDRQVFTVNIAAVDTTIDQLFSFSMRTGHLPSLLSDPSNMIVTEHFARKVFGGADPLGKEITYQGLLYNIAGVMKDWPVNSSFDFDVMIPERSGFHLMGAGFLLLKKGARIEEVNARLSKEVFYGGQKFEYEYRAFRDVYFNKEVDLDVIKNWRIGDQNSLFILGLVGGIILVISLFNYVNIYNVSLLGRGKELGVKKVFGSDRWMLWLGFWLENMVMVFVAVCIAAGLVGISATWIEQTLNVPVRLNPGFDILLFIGILLFLPILISIWPYVKCSRMTPVMAIRNTVSGVKGAGSRRIMLFAQYIMTIVMLIVSLYFIHQLNFMLNRDLGIRQENIVRTTLVGWKEMYVDWNAPEGGGEIIKKRKNIQEEYEKGAEYIENELRNSTCVQEACEGDFPFHIFMHPWKNLASGRDYETCAILGVTPGFEKLYGLQILEGRFFDAEKDQDREAKVVINEAAMKWLEMKSIDDLWLANNYWGAEKKPWKVIGVVKDFHYEHMTRPIQPLVMIYFKAIHGDIPYMMRLVEGREKEALAYLQQLHDKVSPGNTFSYRFLDDEIREMYNKDRKLVQLVTLFTCLAVFISSMGLFGFIVFDTRRKYKEIGIRKVNGASTGEVVWGLMRQFLVMIGVAFLIACPLAWCIIVKYTEDFAERAPISWWIFGAAALLTVLVALLTMLRQSYKAALDNPVEALKGE